MEAILCVHTTSLRAWETSMAQLLALVYPSLPPSIQLDTCIPTRVQLRAFSNIALRMANGILSSISTFRIWKWYQIGINHNPDADLFGF